MRPTEWGEITYESSQLTEAKVKHAELFMKC